MLQLRWPWESNLDCWARECKPLLQSLTQSTNVNLGKVLYQLSLISDRSLSESLFDPFVNFLRVHQELGNNFTSRTLPFLCQTILDFSEFPDPSQILEAPHQQCQSPTCVTIGEKIFSFPSNSSGGICWMSAKTCLVIISCMFLNMFPVAPATTWPDCTFERMFSALKISAMSKFADAVSQKFLCILHYFEKMHQELTSNAQAFTRWISYEKKILLEPLTSSRLTQQENIPLCEFEIVLTGSIEDDQQFAHVDFANATLGGGALGTPALQEEIRFMISPESIGGMLLFEQITDLQAIEICGARIVSKYSGYGRRFLWKGIREIPGFDLYHRLETRMLAMDAACYSMSSSQGQYQPAAALRELNKAYCAFLASENDPQDSRSIATGNWGCGAYAGNPQFKLILQWIAASLAGCKTLRYYTFNESKLSNLDDFVENTKQLSVGTMWDRLCSYRPSSNSTVFDSILSQSN